MRSALQFLIPCALALLAAAAHAQLGSTDYKPTPDHPIGWRGDCTVNTNSIWRII